MTHGCIALGQNVQSEVTAGRLLQQASVAQLASVSIGRQGESRLCDALMLDEGAAAARVVVEKLRVTGKAGDGVGEKQAVRVAASQAKAARLEAVGLTGEARHQAQRARHMECLVSLSRDVLLHNVIDAQCT